MLNAAQIEWASKHDWFVRAYADGSILVRDIWIENGKTHNVLNVWRDSFAALRDWAGY